MKSVQRLALAFLFTLVSADDSALLELTEGNFDVLLRQAPVALVAYCDALTEHHHPNLLPALRELAAAYAHAGIAVGRVSSRYTELLERFQVALFPTLHWMDGSSKWPFYASEASPMRYDGLYSFEAMTAFVQARTGIAPRYADPPVEPEDATEPGSEHRAKVLAYVDEHDCAEPSAAYRACLRHRPPSWQRRFCANERHDYVLCMSDLPKDMSPSSGCCDLGDDSVIVL